MKTSYTPIKQYGVIGNLETCALTGPDGSIDWCCFPQLESSSVFAAMLDLERGGYFQVAPSGRFDSRSEYIPRTNILTVSFTTDTGRAVLTDFMPVQADGLACDPTHQTILRRVEGLEGRTKMRLEFQPRFGYGLYEPSVEAAPRGIAARWHEQELFLQAPFPLKIAAGGAFADFVVHAGESFWIVLQYGHRVTRYPSQCEKILAQTKSYWESWVHACTTTCSVFHGYHHDYLVRSELLLKLLAHRGTGAIAAAPTTSLPEEIGGVRNWDYRYAWIRDASFTAQALHSLGHAAEAAAYFNWVRNVRPARAADGRRTAFQIMYGLHGQAELGERELPHLEGYRASRPVRIGNGAHRQTQLDIYGELLLAFYETTRYGKRISEADWTFMRSVVSEVMDRWREPDSGMWEARSEPRHYTYSKLMCWVALDRAVKMARNSGLKAPTAAWARTRDDIRRAILDRGYNRKLKSFVQYFDGEHLDASSLLIPKMGMIRFRDARVEGTIRATLERLTEHGMVYRYEGDDGIEGKEGAFVLCTFWLVDALALSGRLLEAESIFHAVLSRMGPLGLIAEQIQPATGEFLGNYPQAFSHIGLINSALYLGRATGLKLAGPVLIGEDVSAA